MSWIIDLNLQKENKGNFSFQQNQKKTNPTNKSKKVLTQFFCQTFKKCPTQLRKITNIFQGHLQMKPFYYSFSFIYNVVYKFSQSFLKFQGLLLKESKPFVINTRDLRFFGIQYLYSTRYQYQGFIYLIDQNTGEVRVKNTLIFPEEITNSTEKFEFIIKQIVKLIGIYNEKFVKFLKEITNHSQINNKKVDSIKRVDDTNLIQKYLKICFTQIELSDSEIARRSPIQNSLNNQKILLNHMPVNIQQYSINNSLSLFTIINKMQQNLQNLYLTDQQTRQLITMLKFPKPKVLNNAENQYIFNQIIVHNQKNIQLLRTNVRGGTAEIFMTKLTMQYSNFSKNIYQKKSTNRSIIEKKLLVKSPIDKTHQKYTQHQINIISTMKLANSAYIIKYYKTNQECKIKNKLLMEYIPNSLDLYNFVERNKQTLNLTTKFIILANIANGLRFLKNQRIVHMDLTPKNILIGSGLFTKIIDFGEAYCDKINTRSYKPGFTNPYGPPQVFSQNQFTSKQDVFSYGIVLFELVFGRLPFNPTQQLKKAYKNKTYDKKLFFAIQSLGYYWKQQFMVLLFSLFVRCKNKDPQYRPHASWLRIIMKILANWYNRYQFK